MQVFGDVLVAALAVLFLWRMFVTPAQVAAKEAEDAWKGMGDGDEKGGKSQGGGEQHG